MLLLLLLLHFRLYELIQILFSLGDVLAILLIGIYYLNDSSLVESWIMVLVVSLKKLKVRISFSDGFKHLSDLGNLLLSWLNRLL